MSTVKRRTYLTLLEMTETGASAVRDRLVSRVHDTMQGRVDIKGPFECELVNLSPSAENYVKLTVDLLADQEAFKGKRSWNIYWHAAAWFTKASRFECVCVCD